jgi:hypothetical protein
MIGVRAGETVYALVATILVGAERKTFASPSAPRPALAASMLS